MKTLDLDLNPPLHNIQNLSFRNHTQTARLEPQVDLALMDEALQDLRCVLAGCRSLGFSQIKRPRESLGAKKLSVLGVPASHVVTRHVLTFGRRGHVLLSTYHLRNTTICCHD